MIDVDEFRRDWVRRESSRLMTEGEPLLDIPNLAAAYWASSPEAQLVVELVETRARAKAATVKWVTMVLQDLIDDPELRIALEVRQPALMEEFYSALGVSDSWA